MKKFLNIFKKSTNDYQVFYWSEVVVFSICGLLVSGFFGVILSISHWITFFIGYSITLIIMMKMKHKEINDDIKGYLKFSNEKNNKKS